MTRNEYRNLIGGEWLPARSGKTFSNVNPADHSDSVGEFPSSGAEDVALAVAAAKKVGDEPKPAKAKATTRKRAAKA